VGLVDGLAVRGAADAIIDPVRARLARLRPARPLNLCRLMFMPLDPLIVPPARWRPGDPAIPRTALVPLAATVSAALGAALDPVQALIAGRTSRDRDVPAQAGALLWPQAANCLLGRPPPVGWEATGLGPALYAKLAEHVGALLAQAAALEQLAAAPEPRETLDLLRRVTERHKPALVSCVRLILARAPQAVAFIAAAAQPDLPLRPALEQASDMLVAQLEEPGAIANDIASADLTEASQAVRRLDTLLRHLSDASGPSAPRERLRALRRTLDATCRARFADGLATDFLKPLQAQTLGAHSLGMNSSGMGEGPDLEQVARGLRALESEARQVGGAGVYDALLAEAAQAVRHLQGDGLGAAERVRLVEILAGPELALSMLVGMS